MNMHFVFIFRGLGLVLLFFSLIFKVLFLRLLEQSFKGEMSR